MGIETQVSIWLGPGWDPQLVWALWRRYKFLSLDGNRNTIPQKTSLQPNNCIE